MGVEIRAHLVCSAKTGKIAENSWYTAHIHFLRPVLIKNAVYRVLLLHMVDEL
jgi:hypothetical protein